MRVTHGPISETDSQAANVYSVTPKPDRRTFVNNEKVNKKISSSDGQIP